MTKTLLALSLLFLFGCATSGRVINSEIFLKQEAAFHRMIVKEEKKCFETGGEYTEFGCYYEDEKHIIEKNCLEIGGKWIKGCGCSLDD